MKFLDEYRDAEARVFADAVCDGGDGGAERAAGDLLGEECGGGSYAGARA